MEVRKGIPLNPKSQKRKKAKKIMAIYHFSVKNISRGDGRSAVACSAYRSAENLLDKRQDKTQDYTKKTGVEYKNIYAPENTKAELYTDRQTLWNTVEQTEKRKDASLAREFEIAFPHELSDLHRQLLLDELCQEIAMKHRVIVDACIHAPHTKGGSDERNYHAHIMFTSRDIDPNTGDYAKKKSRDFNKEFSACTVSHWRERFAEITNKHLEVIGSKERIDHRSYKDQENGLTPTQHEGSAVTALRRQYEREQAKPFDERNQEIIMPSIAKQNDAIKEMNLARIFEQEGLPLHAKLKDIANEIQVSETLLAQIRKDIADYKAKEERIKQENEQKAKESLTVNLHDSLLNQMTSEQHRFYKIVLAPLENKQSGSVAQLKNAFFTAYQKDPINFGSHSQQIYYVLNQLKDNEKNTYTLLKQALLEQFKENPTALKSSLMQLDNGFIEKYLENPNFELPKVPQQEQEQVRRQEELVRGASKSDNNKGR